MQIAVNRALKSEYNKNVFYLQKESNKLLICILKKLIKHYNVNPMHCK